MDVRTACLGALTRGPASGYDIRKLFETGPFGHFFEAGFGSIYPALRRLADEGLIEACDPGGGASSRKRVFCITERGVERLRAELTVPPDSDRVRSEFQFLVCLSDLIPVDTVADALAEHRARLRRKMEDQARNPPDADDPPGEHFVFDFNRALCETAESYLAAHGEALLADLASYAPRRGDDARAWQGRGATAEPLHAQPDPPAEDAAPDPAKDPEPEDGAGPGEEDPR